MLRGEGREDGELDEARRRVGTGGGPDAVWVDTMSLRREPIRGGTTRHEVARLPVEVYFYTSPP